MAALPVSPEVAPRMFISLPAFLQQILEKIAEKLQGDILEGQGGAVKKFEDVNAVAVLQRGHLGMSKGRVGTIDKCFQVA